MREDMEVLRTVHWDPFVHGGNLKCMCSGGCGICRQAMAEVANNLVITVESNSRRDQGKEQKREEEGKGKELETEVKNEVKREVVVEQERRAGG